MRSKNHSFMYFFSWLMLGCLIGFAVLLFRGDIRIDINTTDTTSGETKPVTEKPVNSDQNNHRGFADAVMKAAPAVVSIQTINWTQADKETPSDEKLTDRFLGKKSPHLPKRQAETGSGSGVIIRPDGHILTNYHVIENKDEIRVRLNTGKVAIAKLIGSDPDTDLAILKIDAGNLPALSIADINKLKVGDIVLAIGDPFAIGQTVTQGIISATGRTRVSKNTYENFIQTDAAVNPGNSGGALINTRGEIVGINSNIYSSSGNFQGISFAIPIDLAQQLAEEIIEYGYVVRGWLGVEGQELTTLVLQTVNLNSIHGILITAVDSDGPGDKAGLKYGDIITRINQQEIMSTSDILNMIAAGRPGDEFVIEGIRERQSFMTTATLGQRPLMSQ